MALSCTTQSGAMYLDTMLLYFYYLDTLSLLPWTKKAYSVHVVADGGNDGSYMDFMGPFAYSQKVRWYCNIGFGNAFDGS